MISMDPGDLLRHLEKDISFKMPVHPMDPLNFLEKEIPFKISMDPMDLLRHLQTSNSLQDDHGSWGSIEAS